MAKQKNQGFISTVKLGPKGQIVIPKEVRDMFEIGPGDSLVLMADPKRGIALQRQNVMLRIAERIMGGEGKSLYPDEKKDDMQRFASLVQNAAQEDEK